MTNYKQLCAELVRIADALDSKTPLAANQGQALDGYAALAAFRDVANRARAVLARWGNHPGSPDLKPTVPINMTLKSLSEHNREKSFQWQWQSVVSSQPNGIACPECGQELLDTNPSQMILTAPPQFRVHCPSCGYTGSRY